MNDDIKIKNENINFNYRVAIIIKNKNKILVQKDNRVIHYTLPGGRCKLGESSANTAIRELKEETGIDSKFVRGVGLIENFFVSSFTGNKTHEILIIDELKFIDKNNYNKTIIYNIEDHKNKKNHLTYVWKDIEELKKINFKPEIVLDIVNNNSFQHHINIEY